LTVALDATPLLEPSGGIARYVSELARALAAEFPGDQYWLVSDQAWEGGPNLPRGRRPRNWLERRWWLAGLPLELRRLRAAVFHGTDFGAPYLKLRPSVMTFHDCSPWLEGERRQTSAQRIRRRIRWALRAATLVVTPAEAVRRELIERFGLAPSRVVAVPLAASALFRLRSEAEVEAARRRIGIRGPYLLFVGTHDPRKNLGRLVESWRQARRFRPDLQLVLVGRGAPPSPEPGLIAAGRLDDDTVASLMSGAELFVYPSLYEGFGLPVLEAMQTGVPVLISQDAALREVAGQAAVAVDAASCAALTQAIVELAGDPLRRRELRDRGRERAAQFSWRRTAIQTREVYVEAVRRF
jgi:glycosyltransferase involved in cell wall biosynthesis